MVEHATTLWKLRKLLKRHICTVIDNHLKKKIKLTIVYTLRYWYGVNIALVSQYKKIVLIYRITKQKFHYSEDVPHLHLNVLKINSLMKEP